MHIVKKCVLQPRPCDSGFAGICRCLCQYLLSLVTRVMRVCSGRKSLVPKGSTSRSHSQHFRQTCPMKTARAEGAGGRDASPKWTVVEGTEHRSKPGREASSPGGKEIYRSARPARYLRLGLPQSPGAAAEPLRGALASIESSRSSVPQPGRHQPEPESLRGHPSEPVIAARGANEPL